MVDLTNLGLTVKPKVRPTNRGFVLDKSKPLGPYNCPLTAYTEWHAFGYNRVGIFKRPQWITKVLPTGKPFVPDLDVVLRVDSRQFGPIYAREGQKKEFQKEDEEGDLDKRTK
jgi:hypothetical protein